MDNVQLGELIRGDAERDAIHVAIAPVTAGHDLYPGQHVTVEDGVARAELVPVGIVDPFLTHKVQDGDRCYVFLYPNTVTGMRHHWSHPAFDGVKANDTKEESRRWLESFAAEIDMDFGELVNVCRRFIEEGTYAVQHGSDSWRDVAWDSRELLWQHYENWTGETVEDKDGVPFSCSC